jgi:mRNA interferase YafQ
MLEIQKSHQFKKDFKREINNAQHKNLLREFEMLIQLLQTESPLPPRYRLHRLKGEYLGYLECHLRPDLLMIFQVKDGKVLQLVRLGSHSELFK